MDIEGAEYNIIPKRSNSGIKTKQILIGFYHQIVTNGGGLTKKSTELLRKADLNYLLISILLKSCSSSH